MPGAQVFPGLRPSNETDDSRTNAAVYVDLEGNLAKRLRIGTAGRFEHYSDFGSNVDGKLTPRIQAHERLVIRGAASTGFRAPSLAQSHFSAVSTNFINIPGQGLTPVEVGTFGQRARQLAVPAYRAELARRQFLKGAAATGIAAVLPLKMAVREAWAQYGFNSPNLTKFVDLYRPVGVIPIATADTLAAPVTGVTHYTIDIGPFNDVLHSDFVTPATARAGIAGWLPPPAYAFIATNFVGTKLWGFNPAPNGMPGTPKHLGGVIVAYKGTPIQITFRNNLPTCTLSPLTSPYQAQAPLELFRTGLQYKGY